MLPLCLSCQEYYSDMRNVFKIFKHDLRLLYKNFFAFLIILAILVLPALYAWFNIYAFWDPYSKTDGLKIAVVSNDKDYMDSDGNIVNMGKSLISELENEENLGFEFLDNADEAIEGVYAGDYYAAVVIEPDFTYNMYNFLTTDMYSPTIKFYQNEKTNAVAVKVVEAAGDKVKQVVNEKYISTVVETLFDKLNAFSADVQGDSSAEMLKNTLTKINNNLISYNTTIDYFISANNALIDTLQRTNNTLNYSIYLIGNERVNISDQIVYIEDTKEDLALINEEVNRLLLGLQDSVNEAIYKLDRLYNGNTDDAEAAKEALAELEKQYQELIDYLTHSGLSNSEIEDAMTALNKLTDKISSLRDKLGLNNPTSAKQVNVLASHNKSAIAELKTDFETVAVPAVYEAVTGYDYNDLSDPSATPQSMESLVSFMTEDTSDRIASIQENLSVAQTTSDPEVRNEALESARTDTRIVEQELSALSATSEAVSTASNTPDTVSGSIDSATGDVKSAGDVLDDILNGNRDIDLIRDLQLISDTLGTVRVTLTETVYPMLNNMLDNLQDSLGEVSSTLLDLSGILGKTTPIVSELGSTFGAVNNALIQVKDLLTSYSTRITEFIDLLDGNPENGTLQNVFDFLDVDPESIGTFLSSPVSMRSESIYPVESYGAAMTPFYTMLAIWVGCVIINAIVSCDAPIEVIGATETQRFFGRYLLFFLLSQLQTLVTMLGNLVILGVDCMHPGLLLLSGFVTSLACSMLAYAFAVAFGNIGRALIVVILIIQIAGSGGSYPIELLPNFFQQVYLFFPFPYAINAMREAIAGLYQNQYLIYLLQLMLFFVVGLLIGIFARRSLSGLNKYMNEQLEKTEMM